MLLVDYGMFKKQVLDGHKEDIFLTLLIMMEILLSLLQRIIRVKFGRLKKKKKIKKNMMMNKNILIAVLFLFL